jgi:hypothetical protein
MRHLSFLPTFDQLRFSQSSSPPTARNTGKWDLVAASRLVAFQSIKEAIADL